MGQIDNASIDTVANVYFDGKCVSHTIHTPSGERKSVGVILPSTLTFTTGAPEIMELQQGRCRVRLAGSDEWSEYHGGSSFSVGADAAFDIEVLEPVHYICHYG